MGTHTKNNVVDNANNLNKGSLKIFADEEKKTTKT